MSYHNLYVLNESFSARSVLKGKQKPSPCAVIKRNKSGGFDVGVVPQNFSNDAVRRNRQYKPKLEKLKTFLIMEDAQIYLDELLSNMNGFIK
jgi:hypothetical protein|nr:MAG TPA: hypothetical protein [Caudoviricetes sp.]